MQQNHPCVIEIIRRSYLHPPADPFTNYQLKNPKITDPSVGQAATVIHYLKNQVIS